MVFREPPIAMDTLTSHVPEDAVRDKPPSPTFITTELGVSPKSVALMRSGMERAGWTLWMLTVCAGLSGSLFGYDTGYMCVCASLTQFVRAGQRRLRPGPSPD